MPKEAVFSLKLETELRDQFMAEAEAAHRPASQLVRDLMRDFVKRQREERDYDFWFRAQVQEALTELQDPNAVLIPHEQVSARMRQWREDNLAKIAKREE